MRRSNGADLREVMQQVAQVVFGQEPKSYRLTGADAARRFELSGRQVGDDVGKMPIVAGPQRNQDRPGRFFHGLNTHPLLLVVSGEVERALQGGSHKALMIVRGRIDQVPEELLA